MVEPRPKRILGVDIGGVIIDGSAGVSSGDDTDLDDEGFLETPAIAGAIRMIAQLNLAFDQTYLISKARPATRERTNRWLKHHNFYGLTGIVPQRVIYTDDRIQKAVVASLVGISHFVDDKLEVLKYLKGVARCRVLFRSDPSEVTNFIDDLPGVFMVDTWAQAAEVLRVSP
ncbi:MAG TPA: hypothetical protein VLF67_04025 [Candidatus Saccharimonas sp.]|nr:hypothetical protein [Candidatus Saccharimonas sp.]